VADFVVVRLLCALALAVLTLLSVARPASADDSARFKELVRQATEAFGKGDFQRAIELCNEAYALKPNPRLLYNRARAHEALGNAERAVRDYELYLEREPQTEDREIVTGRIKALRAQVAEQERLAGERAQSAGKRAAAKAHYRRYLELNPSASDKQEIEKRIRDLDRPPKKQPEPTNDSGQRAPGGAGAGPWITIALGGAVLAGGGILGLLSRQKYDDAKSASSGEAGAALRDDGDRLTTFANVGFIAGGVIAISGVTWFLLSPSSTEKSSKDLRRRSVGRAEWYFDR
jgi:tetratricopeptide (TPR) repeat protein